MADKKITELTNITGANLVDADEFVVVDISADETKAITLGELKEAFDSGSGFVRITGDTMTGDLALSGADVTFGDNDKAIFGAGSDLQIYHDGNHSYIEDAGTGSIKIKVGDFRVENASGNNLIKGVGDIATLHHAGAEKLATTSTGIDVTGTVTADAYALDSIALPSAGTATIFNRNTDNNLYIQTGSGNTVYLLDGSQNTMYAASPTSHVFQISNAEKMRLDSSGNVGIGTSSPDNKVNIQESALSGRAASNGNTSLTLEHATDTGIQFFSATQTQLRFGDAASTGAGSIIYEHATDKLRLNTDSLITFEDGGVERMRIDSSGNVMVGTTNGAPVSNNVVGISARGQYGELQVSTEGSTGAPLYLNRKTSDGIIAVFRKDGNTVGSIGVENSSDLTIGNADTGLRFVAGDDAIWPFNMSTGADRDNAVSLGVPAARFKDLYLSGTAYVDTAVEIHAGNSLKLQNVSGNGFATIQNAGAGTNTDLSFNTAGSEAMRIDSSGNLLVGSTNNSPATNNVAGSSHGSLGNIQASVDGNPCLFVNRKSNDGDIISIRKDGSAVGSIGTNSGYLKINSGNSSFGSGVEFHNLKALPVGANGASSNGTVNLGDSDRRWKDAYLSGGVYLGGTGAANKLDDYEEGTFSPSFNGSSSNPSVTYTSQNGIYVKIGNMVYLSMGLNWSAFSGGSGNLRLGGLPFEPNNANSMRAVGSISYSDAFTGLSNAYGLEPHTNISSAAAGTYFYYKNATGNIANYIDTSDVKSSGSLQVCLIYRTT